MFFNFDNVITSVGLKIVSALNAVSQSAIEHRATIAAKKSALCADIWLLGDSKKTTLITWEGAIIIRKIWPLFGVYVLCFNKIKKLGSVF